MVCSLCLTEYNNIREASRHSVEFHGIHLILCCKFCNKFFLDISLYEEHSKIHRKELTCRFCGLEHTSKYSLNKHVKIHPEFSIFNCPYCGMVFENSKDLDKHKRKIHLKTLYTCEICGRSHGSKQLLDEHKLIHSAHKRFV